MPRKPRGSGVRGPNSALTEFLRTEGITDAFRERQQREAESNSQTQTPQPEEASLTATITPAGSETPQVIEDDDEEEQIRAAGRRKRRIARTRSTGGDPGSDGSNSGSDSDFRALGDDLAGEELDGMTNFGEEDVCVECGNSFTLTVYSRYLQDLKGYLCDDCNEMLKKKERAIKRNQVNARKRRKKLAQALLDKKTVRLPTLQDVCIKTITLNISDVEALGDIGQLNINKISRILSKNRSLNDDTVSLFLSPDVKSLEFWDCSNVSSHLFNQIAAYCSALESLTIFMCGQFHNDNLIYFKDKLPKLTKLSFNGPFLISNQLWQDFFDQAQCKLQDFEVRNTHRFGNQALISLLENRGSDLTSLKLSRLDGLDSASVYELIPQYLGLGQLTSLEISYPYKEELVSDDLLIHILAITGESLKYLNVDGCTGLTDLFLIEGIAKFCPYLEVLSMKNLDHLTDEGFVEAFQEFSVINTGGLVTVDLTKCIGLGNMAVYTLLKHSGETLVELSLNSLDKLTKSFLVQILTDDTAEWKQKLEKAIKDGINDNLQEGEEHTEFYSKVNLPLLTKLDIGFVRSFDNEVTETFSTKCSKLTYLEVYGDNRCTSKAKVRSDLLVIGRQGDAI